MCWPVCLSRWYERPYDGGGWTCLLSTGKNKAASLRFLPGAVARSEASLISTSGTFFRGDLVIKTFLQPFSLFRWFKKSICQLLAKECALSTGKLPRRLAQEQCGEVGFPAAWKRGRGAFRKRAHGARWVIRKGHILCARYAQKTKGVFPM